jgi:uncharacterized protein (DUF1697 family)
VTRWVALLRGVNVGGVTVKSAQLAEVFRALGFDDVKTVLASGNVLFSTEGDVGALTNRLETALSDEFGYTARVVVVEQSTVAAVVNAYPFAEVDDKQPYVVFASDPTMLEDLGEGAGSGDDIERIAAGDGVLYWEVRRGMSTDSPFSKRTTRLKGPGILTTRNLRTLRKLL